MIKARHHSVIHWFFRGYVHHILRRHFHAINVIGDVPSGSGAVLLIGNHFSWWDGFMAFYLNNTLLKKRFHVMMLEEQLARRKYFTGLGAFSVRPGSRSMFQSMHYASSILGDPENLLVMYPQGRIESAYIRHIHFGKGILHILKGVEGPRPELLMYVALVDYFSNRKPTLSIYLKRVLLPSGFSLAMLEKACNDFYDACITLQKV